MYVAVLQVIVSITANMWRIFFIFIILRRFLLKACSRDSVFLEEKFKRFCINMKDLFGRLCFWRSLNCMANFLHPHNLQKVLYWYKVQKTYLVTSSEYSVIVTERSQEELNGSVLCHWCGNTISYFEMW